ncbi:CRISPR-associated endonuclease Cas9 [compost metagenome]
MLKFHLSPNDLVYIPDNKNESDQSDFNNLDKQQINNLYKMVSSSTYQCFFIRNDVSTSIVNKIEFSSLNKMEKTIEGIMIKESCIKVRINRLGNISKA